VASAGTTVVNATAEASAFSRHHAGGSETEPRGQLRRLPQAGHYISLQKMTFFDRGGFVAMMSLETGLRLIAPAPSPMVRTDADSTTHHR
jgi:hypothetical protein